MNAQAFLVALAIVLGIAAVVTVLFQRVRLPVVLGYIAAGFIVGPHVPIPLVADPKIVHTLSELGVVLLMFSLGLEFSLTKLLSLGARIPLTAILETSLMVWLGFIVGQAFGWTWLECIFAGAILAISSTTIIAKSFDELRIRGEIRELVFGVLIVEDLVAILLMAALTAIATGAGLSAMTLAMTVGKLAAFLIVLIAVGFLLVPRGTRAIVALGRKETTVVAAVGFCFGIALLAQQFGYSVALGAFIAGSLIAESGVQEHVEEAVQPVRDVFAAIFFVSVGMQIDPSVVATHFSTIVAMSIVLILGKIIGVGWGALLTGNSVRTSVRAGMALAQIGEFSFIIASLGLTLKATGTFLYAVAVAVSAITTLTTPWLIRASGPLAELIDRKLPHRLQTFVSLYASWVEQLKRGSKESSRGQMLRRLARLVIVDAVALALLAIATGLGSKSAERFVSESLGTSTEVARFGVLGVAAAIALPLAIGIARTTHRLAAAIAEAVMPMKSSGLDRAAAPRRVLMIAVQLAIVFLVGLPFLAVTQPLIRGAYGPILLALLLAWVGFALWRGTADLQGHVRAGAQVIVESLVAKSREGFAPPRASAPLPLGHALTAVQELLPGLGTPTPVTLPVDANAVGRSLAELNVRGLTGATVLAIGRGNSGLQIPSAKEVLEAGDVLALAGSDEAIAAARELLMALRSPCEREQVSRPSNAGA